MDEFLQALLGGIEGAGNFYQKDFLDSQKAKDKSAQDKKNFRTDILKGLIINSSKPKGSSLNFGDDLVENFLSGDDATFLEGVNNSIVKPKAKGPGMPGMNPFSGGKVPVVKNPPQTKPRIVIK